MSGTLFFKQLLSGSTNGRPIAVAATASPGTLIHTAVSGTTDFDEIWLWASSHVSPGTLLTLEWGGTSTSDQMVQGIRSGEGVTVCPGWALNNGLIVRAFLSAGDSNEVNIVGFVNQVRLNQ